MPVTSDGGRRAHAHPAPSSSAEAEYDSRPLNPHRLDAVLRHVRDSYLDVGCGNGGYVRAVAPDARAVGVDRRPFPSWNSPLGEFVVGSAESLPVADSSFHTVSCFETLEHLPDPEAALRELRRVTRQTLLLTVPNCEVTPGQRASNLIYHHWIDPTHRNFWSYDEFIAFVECAGWVVKEAGRVNDIDLLPMFLEAFAPSGLRAMAARRLLPRIAARSYSMTTLVVAQRSES